MWTQSWVTSSRWPCLSSGAGQDDHQKCLPTLTTGDTHYYSYRLRKLENQGSLFTWPFQTACTSLPMETHCTIPKLSNKILVAISRTWCLLPSFYQLQSKNNTKTSRSRNIQRICCWKPTLLCREINVLGYNFQSIYFNFYNSFPQMQLHYIFVFSFLAIILPLTVHSSLLLYNHVWNGVNCKEKWQKQTAKSLLKSW